MSIKIYNNEIADGLEDLIKASASFTIDCKVEKLDSEQDSELIDKAIASVGSENVPSVKDLYKITSILASVGKNKNDDYFLAEELWAARSTPIYKRFNFMHDEDDIIGVITNSYIVDAEGNTIESEDSIDKISDIVTEAVIWTEWDDEKKNARFQSMIDSIEAGSMFVSMETLFRNFDYMLDGEIVERTKSTAFLTKHLRIFGGSGLYENKSISRVIRNATFSGKGLVSKPANPRSLILQTEAMEKEMAEDNVAQVVELEKAKATLEQKLETAGSELETAKAKIVEVEKQRDSLAEEIKSMKTESAKASESHASDIEKLESELVEAKAKVQELEDEKVLLSRKAQLVEANVDESKLESILTNWASASDEQFAEIVGLYASQAAAPEKPAKSDDFEDEEIAKADASEDAQKPNELEKKEDSADDTQKALASEIADLFGLKKSGE